MVWNGIVPSGLGSLSSLGSILGSATVDAPSFGPGWLSYLTNSIFVGVIVMLIILFFCRMATKKMTLIPSSAQNLVEYVVEFLYNQVESIVGSQVAKRAFPLLATLFLYIVISNWIGLFPGVGTLGFAHKEALAPVAEVVAEASDAHATVSHAHDAEHQANKHYPLTGPLTLHPNDTHFTPLLRPPTGDLNTTLGLALVFMIVWFVVTMIESGPVEFIKHIFAPKGGLTGIMKYALVPIFLFVGVIEVISIAFRPVSLSFRLFGNVYAGENLLAEMAALGEQFFGPIGAFLTRVFVPLPFYFMEILVGLLQGVVFTLLCAVYIKLSTSHDDHDDHDHEHGDEHGTEAAH